MQFHTTYESILSLLMYSSRETLSPKVKNKLAPCVQYRSQLLSMISRPRLGQIISGEGEIGRPEIKYFARAFCLCYLLETFALGLVLAAGTAVGAGLELEDERVAHSWLGRREQGVRIARIDRELVVGRCA